MNKVIPVIFFITLIFLTLFSYLFIDPNLIYLKPLVTDIALTYRPYVSVLYLLVVCVLYFIYFLFIRYFNEKILSPRLFKKIIRAAIAILFVSYPAMLSFDIFNYVATAKVAFFYHENPYIIMPIEFLHDPLLLFMHAANKTALYGPVWILLTSIPHYLGLNNFIVTLFLFKFLVIIFFIYTNFILYTLSKSWVPVLLFSLNPLVLFETLVSGHNDIVMVGLMLTAYLFLFKKRYIIALLFLFLSVGIKFATLFLFPIFVYIFILILRKKQFNYEKIYLYSAIAMFLIFLLSPLREEMYPWYAQWFLPFVFLMPERKNLVLCSQLLSFGLLLRYLPFMYVGYYHSPTPELRVILMLLPLCLYFFIIRPIMALNK